MAKKWMVVGALVVLAGGAGVVLKATNKQKPKEQESPFRLGKTQVEDLQVSVREVGVVDPEIKVDVKSPVSGRVLELDVREGDLVARGQVLAEVEPDVNQAQSLSDVHAAVSQADLRLRDADRILTNQKALFAAGLVANDQLRDAQMVRDLAADALRNAKARYNIVEQHGIPISGGHSQQANVSTPMAGIVIAKGVELGESVTSGVSSFNEGTVLFTVADLKSLLIKVNLNEVDIAKVRVGQPVRITLDAYPQKVFTGKIRFVAPAAKIVDKIKVFQVEIALDQLDDAFRTGMSANVEILGESRPKTLSIPLEALQRRDGKTVVYRLKPNLPEKQVAKAREA